MSKKTTQREKYVKLLSEIGENGIGQELLYLLKSRYKIVWIRTREERRVLDTYRYIALAEGCDVYQWDIARGLLDTQSLKQVGAKDAEYNINPSAICSWIVERAKILYDEQIEGKIRASDASIFLLLDFHHFLDPSYGMHELTERYLKEFASIPGASQIVIVSPEFQCPSTLESEVNLIEFPYPSEHELRRTLQQISEEIVINLPHALETAKQKEEELIKAVKGLTLTEAENAFAKTLVKNRDFQIETILEEKQQAIKKNGILEYLTPRYTFDDIGGLGTLREWLEMRRLSFTDRAVEYGLSQAKGVLLVGVPGGGKSLTCEAMANFYQLPLLRLDMGSLFSSFVGDSERNTREVIKVAESLAPCCLWVDEIEKGIGGMRSSGERDGGTTSRVLATLLSWMQDKTALVFVACTANNVADIPPEFMRAGRFDEVFFVDLPDAEQRAEVIERLLRRKKRNPENFDVQAIVEASKNYSPAEIEKGINSGMFASYADQERDVTTDDIVDAIRSFQPLYNSRRNEIDRMREWALGRNGEGARAVLANSQSKPKRTDYTVKNERMINIDESVL